MIKPDWLRDAAIKAGFADHPNHDGSNIELPNGVMFVLFPDFDRKDAATFGVITPDEDPDNAGTFFTVEAQQSLSLEITLKAFIAGFTAQLGHVAYQRFQEPLEEEDENEDKRINPCPSDKSCS